eukprot:CAMPEP_0170825362 /NCGR_PEP_ID=MMETSP0733-20121128/45899_1 /TAXON_ID=186038 /ORGANISM="Fragilariopsis kerguelensis, Strain L26-C5" /LENGTH=855 /DNA_ID=CAMNT_0011188877 /DNA_START=177 /DNA_END=2741 /DNA_ORIENTATION=+
MCQGATARTNDRSEITNSALHDSKAVFILSTGAAYGNHYTTEQVLAALIRQQKAQGNDDFDVEFASRVLNKCGFERHSIALELNDVFRRFTRSEYLQHRSTNLVALAERAGKMALDRWGGNPRAITHLFWGTMTGAMHSPTIDIELTRRLGLNPDVERTNIEGMGCLTGFRLVNLARQVVQGNPEARALVVAADLRSALGNSLPPKPTREDIVSISLFRDAASSVVVGASIRTEESPCYEIVTGASRIVDGTSHLVDYYEADDGSIRLHLGRKLPESVGKAEPDFVASILQKADYELKKSKCSLPSLQDIDILCHTGGPRVLIEVAKSLGVSKQKMFSSWEVMTQHGNLSGASNLAILDHHNQMKAQNISEWALCLSMGPGVCLEGILLRDVRRALSRSNRDLKSARPTSYLANHLSYNCNIGIGNQDSRKVIHIVGGGIAGLTLAAALDPQHYIVQVFEASPEVREQGYGLAIWPSTMRVLRDMMGIVGLDLKQSNSMTVRSINQKLDIQANVKDKGFMQRSSLLRSIKHKVEDIHPGCIHTGHKCLRVKLEEDRASATFETDNSKNPIVSHSCDLLVGADGVNSTVRRYVALEKNSKLYGHMTAYRFLIPCPSKELLRETHDKWNMSVGVSIHSPCYHVTNSGSALNVVVLEYDGKQPSNPRRPSFEELRDVAQRSKLSFVVNLIENEEISDLMCYSTFHIDCEPWYQPNAVILGDAAHAYGPLTAKMANLAINDAHCLAIMLNHRLSRGVSQEQILQEWQMVQRPKFDVTRIRTLRHLQLYSPKLRFIIRIFWKYAPNFTLKYFGSIFAYDYKVFGQNEMMVDRSNSKTQCMGVVGIDYADPIAAYLKRCAW